MPSLRLAVLASGRGTDLQSILDASREARISSRVVVVVSDRQDAKALERARGAGIVAECVPLPAGATGAARRQSHEERIQKVLAHYKVDLVVLAGFMRILSPEFVRNYPNRIVNIHPSLLPGFPGVHAQNQALGAGVRVTGCTTHFVDDQVDHGPILLQAAVLVKAGDTEETLSQRILDVEHELLPRTIRLFEEGRVRVVGRRVEIQPGDSWRSKVSPNPDVLYGDGY